MKIKKIVISQPEPQSEKSPYADVAQKYGVKIDFRKFIQVEGTSSNNFRKQKIDILSHTAVIFSTKTGVDHFFRICEEVRVSVPDSMKYFCISESIALYLQKYITYRKRKIFFSSDNTFTSLIDHQIKKHKDENYLVVLPDGHKPDIPKALVKANIKHTKAILYKTVSSKLSDLKLEAQTTRYLTSLVYSKKWEESRERAAAAWERFPDELIYPEIENIANYNLEDYDRVVSTCRKVISMHPKDTSVTIPYMSSLGDALYQGGNKKEAFKTYEKVLKKRPDYNLVLNNYAYFLSLEGKKLSKAQKMSRQTVITDPDNATYLDTYGWILHLQGNDAEAKKFFKRAMLYGGKENVTVMEHYAEVLEALGEEALARVYRSNAQTKK